MYAKSGQQIKKLVISRSEGDTLRPEAETMSTLSCRDCGYSLAPDARGCPQCALNLEAENMIDRVVWRRIVPVSVIVLLTATGILIYLLR